MEMVRARSEHKERVCEIEGRKGVMEMQRRKQEKACWQWQPSPSFRTLAMAFSFCRERGRAGASKMSSGR
jgi:hypothetical protein